MNWPMTSRICLFLFLCAALSLAQAPAASQEGWLDVPLSQRVRAPMSAPQARSALEAVQAATRRLTLLLQGGTSDQSALQSVTRLLERERAALLDIERMLDEAQRMPERRTLIESQIADARDALRLQRASEEGQRQRERDFTASASTAFAGMDADTLAIRRREAGGEIVAVRALISAARDEERLRRERVASLAQTMSGRMDSTENLRAQLAVVRASQAALERATRAAESAGSTGAALWLPRETEYAAELEALRLEGGIAQSDDTSLEVRGFEIELAQLQQDEAEARHGALDARLSAIAAEQETCLSAEDSALLSAVQTMRASPAPDTRRLRILEVRRERLALERARSACDALLQPEGPIGTALASVQALTQRVKAVEGGDNGALPLDYEALAVLTHSTEAELAEVERQLLALAAQIQELSQRNGERQREFDALAMTSVPVGADSASHRELRQLLADVLRDGEALNLALAGAREAGHRAETDSRHNLRALRTRLLWSRRGGSLDTACIGRAIDDIVLLGPWISSESAASFEAVVAVLTEDWRNALLVVCTLMLMVVGSVLIRRRLPNTFSWMEAHQLGDSGRLWRLLATFIRQTNAVFLIAVGWCALCLVQMRSPFSGVAAILLLTPFCWRGLRTAGRLLLAPQNDADRVLRIDTDFAVKLQRTVDWLLILSFVFVPCGLLLQEGGYAQRNPAFMELWWFSYSIAFPTVLLLGVLRPSLLAGWMRARALTPGVRMGLIFGWPVLVAAVMSLLALHLLRYDFAAATLQSALLRTAVIIAAALSTYHLGFGRVLRKLKTDAVQREDFDTHAEWGAACMIWSGDLALRAGVRLLVFIPVAILFWNLGADLIEAAIPERVTSGAEWQLGIAVLRGLLVAVTGVVVLRHAARLLRHVFLPRTRMDAGVQYATATLCTYVLVAALLVIVLKNFEVESAQIAWALTALSVGIGFGLQDLVRSSVAGLILLVQRPLRVGDMISMGERTGIIEEITLRSTTVRTPDNATLVIPNQALLNEMRERVAVGELLRLRVRMGVAYDTDIAKVRTMVREELMAFGDVRQRPAPEVLVMETAESAVILEIWFWVQHTELRPRVEARVREGVLRKLRDGGVVIPLPQLDIRVQGPQIQP